MGTPSVGSIVLVDRLLAHPRPPLQSCSFANYFRRPTLFDPRFGIDTHRLRKPPGARPPGLRLRLLMGLLRSVAAPSSVPHYLSAYATRGSPQSPTHLTKQLKGDMDRNPDLIDALATGLANHPLPTAALQSLPCLNGYTLIQWALQNKSEGQGYGFPFDRPYQSWRLHVRRVVRKACQLD